MNSFLRIAALSIVVAVSGSMVAWQDFQKGIAATEAGDYATAVKELLPLHKCIPNRIISEREWSGLSGRQKYPVGSARPAQRHRQEASEGSCQPHHGPPPSSSHQSARIEILSALTDYRSGMRNDFGNVWADHN